VICVSEILEHRLTIIKEYSVAKFGCGFAVVKSLDKHEQRYYISATVVAMLLTRLPISKANDRRFQLYIGVIILFDSNGIITPTSL